MPVLIITNKEDITVDFVVKELQNRNITYYRLNTEDIPQYISINFDYINNKFFIRDNLKKMSYSLLDFSSVYYRRPQLNGLNYIDDLDYFERSYLMNELNFILEGIYKLLEKKYWLNNVYKIREAENKIFQLQIAKELGFLIPETLISNQYERVYNFHEENNRNCIIKPIKSGNMPNHKDSKAIFTTKLDKKQLELPERIKSFPLYIQKNIKKQSDIRVTVVGELVFAAEIHSQNYLDSTIDWRKGSKKLKHSKFCLPKRIENLCIQLTKYLSLNYSAIDLIYTTKGEFIFLEINPNGQWAWIEHLLNFPISKEIVNLLENGGE